MIDDALLIFGTCCLICGLALLFTVMDTMYMTEALVFGPQDIEIPSDFPNRVSYYYKLNGACIVLSWFAIMSIKFSFLALFRKLIDRIPFLIIYWWVVVILNIATSAYGVAVTMLVCPSCFGITTSKLTKTSN